MRFLAISDIHGCLDELNQILDTVNYNCGEDQLVLLGDYVDRGQKSKQVLNKVIDLVNNGAIALRGNHDQMFIDWLTTDDNLNEMNYLNNGGMMTILSYVGPDFFDDKLDLHEAKLFIIEHYKNHLDFIKKLPYYHETEQYIFVHAGINPFYKDWKETPNNEMIWIREPFLNNDNGTDKVVVHGHTPCVNLHGNPNVYFGNEKIGIDGACAYGYQLNCLEIDEDNLKAVYVERCGTFAL